MDFLGYVITQKFVYPTLKQHFLNNSFIFYYSIILPVALAILPPRYSPM